MDIGAWQATIHGVAKSGHSRATFTHTITEHESKVFFPDNVIAGVTNPLISDL